MTEREDATARRLAPREAIARCFPTWDHAVADRIIYWLDHCGYEIVDKNAGTDIRDRGSESRLWKTSSAGPQLDD
jgi:hypothetical protein